MLQGKKLSETTKSHDAEDILSEFQHEQHSEEKNIEETPQRETIIDNSTNSDVSDSDESHKERDVIFIGTKPIMAYVSALLTQLAIQPTVTIKARGKRITQAVDVSQMIIKRMDTVGYVISDVRISSDSLKSQDGKQRNVSNIEIDITKT